jgi:hypothetical protein
MYCLLVKHTSIFYISNPALHTAAFGRCSHSISVCYFSLGCPYIVLGLSITYTITNSIHHYIFHYFIYYMKCQVYRYHLCGGLSLATHYILYEYYFTIFLHTCMLVPTVIIFIFASVLPIMYLYYYSYYQYFTYL